jgi:hypothetical protein
MAGEVVEPDGARYSYIRCGCTEGAHLERTRIRTVNVEFGDNDDNDDNDDIGD